MLPRFYQKPPSPPADPLIRAPFSLPIMNLGSLDLSVLVCHFQPNYFFLLLLNLPLLPCCPVFTKTLSPPDPLIRAPFSLPIIHLGSLDLPTLLSLSRLVTGQTHILLILPLLSPFPVSYTHLTLPTICSV